jgi:chromosome segregation ATPase
VEEEFLALRENNQQIQYAYDEELNEKQYLISETKALHQKLNELRHQWEVDKKNEKYENSRKDQDLTKRVGLLTEETTHFQEKIDELEHILREKQIQYGELFEETVKAKSENNSLSAEKHLLSSDLKELKAKQAKTEENADITYKQAKETLSELSSLQQENGKMGAQLEEKSRIVQELRGLQRELESKLEKNEVEFKKVNTLS